jgi:hypothetical protein
MALKRVTDTGPACENYIRGRVGERDRRDEAFGVSLRGTAVSADLGGSSKHTNENFVDRRGEGFHVNSNWTWVSRS